MFKILYRIKSDENFQLGTTLLELVAVVAILLILTTALVFFINPSEQMKKARDKQRLSDMSTIDRAINEFLLDNKRYPDQEEILRISTSLPPGSSDLARSNLGWIHDNMSKYISNLPIDPLNNDEYYYSYFHDLTGYEINAKLEILNNEMINDGGNDPNMYELGNNLNLISP